MTHRVHSSRLVPLRSEPRYPEGSEWLSLLELVLEILPGPGLEEEVGTVQCVDVLNLVTRFDVALGHRGAERSTCRAVLLPTLVNFGAFRAIGSVDSTDVLVAMFAVAPVRRTSIQCDCWC